MDLGISEVFGEDSICYAIANSYSVKVESPKLTLLAISNNFL